MVVASVCHGSAVWRGWPVVLCEFGIVPSTCADYDFSGSRRC